MKLDEAIATAKSEVKDPYALSYLEAIPDAIEINGTEALKVQILYALNNMKTWRGESARKAKKAMKTFATKS